MNKVIIKSKDRVIGLEFKSKESALEAVDRYTKKYTHLPEVTVTSELDN